MKTRRINPFCAIYRAWRFGAEEVRSNPRATAVVPMAAPSRRSTVSSRQTSRPRAGRRTVSVHIPHKASPRVTIATSGDRHHIRKTPQRNHELLRRIVRSSKHSAYASHRHCRHRGGYGIPRPDGWSSLSGSIPSCYWTTTSDGNDSNYCIRVNNSLRLPNL